MDLKVGDIVKCLVDSSEGKTYIFCQIEGIDDAMCAAMVSVGNIMDVYPIDRLTKAKEINPKFGKAFGHDEIDGKYYA